MNQKDFKRKLTAILSADVFGYSRLMEADEAWTIQSLEENKKLMSTLIAELNGRVVDSPADTGVPFPLTAWEIHPNGKKFLMAKPPVVGAATTEKKATATKPKIHIVLNFFEGLKQQVQVD